jgi:hypothetical protein
MTDVFPFRDPGLWWDFDGQLHVSHPPGTLCQTAGEHLSEACGALRYEPGPFAKCSCAEHWSRVAHAGQPLQGEPVA